MTEDKNHAQCIANALERSLQRLDDRQLVGLSRMLMRTRRPDGTYDLGQLTPWGVIFVMSCAGGIVAGEADRRGIEL